MSNEEEANRPPPSSPYYHNHHHHLLEHKQMLDVNETRHRQCRLEFQFSQQAADGNVAFSRLAEEFSHKGTFVSFPSPKFHFLGTFLSYKGTVRGPLNYHNHPIPSHPIPSIKPHNEVNRPQCNQTCKQKISLTVILLKR